MLEDGLYCMQTGPKPLASRIPVHGEILLATWKFLLVTRKFSDMDARLWLQVTDSSPWIYYLQLVARRRVSLRRLCTCDHCSTFCSTLRLYPGAWWPSGKLYYLLQKHTEWIPSGISLRSATRLTTSYHFCVTFRKSCRMHRTIIVRFSTIGCWYDTPAQITLMMLMGFCEKSEARLLTITDNEDITYVFLNFTEHASKLENIGWKIECAKIFWMMVYCLHLKIYNVLMLSHPAHSPIRNQKPKKLQ